MPEKNCDECANRQQNRNTMEPCRSCLMESNYLKMPDSFLPRFKLKDEFKRENKYLVLKLDDIQKYLAPWDRVSLKEVCECVEIGRKLDGKKDNRYVVVNEDEPYAEKVWELIKQGLLNDKGEKP